MDKVEKLLQNLKYLAGQAHEGGETRRKAAEELGNIGDARAIKPLIEAIADKNTDVMWFSEEAIVKFGQTALPALLEAITNRKRRIRRTKLVPYLISTLDNEDNNTKRYAIVALAILKDQRAINPLIELIGSDGLDVNFAAVRSLEKFGKEALEPLLKAFKEEKFYSDDKWIGWAAHVLGKIQDPRAIDTLVQVVKMNRDSKSSATGALGEIGTPAIPALLKLLEEENHGIRWCVVNALGKTNDERAIDPLMRMLKEGDVSADLREIFGKKENSIFFERLMELYTLWKTLLSTALSKIAKTEKFEVINLLIGVLQRGENDLQGKEKEIRMEVLDKFRIDKMDEKTRELTLKIICYVLQEINGQISRNTEVRARALTSLSELSHINGTKIVDAIIDAALNDKEEVRANAAQALGKIEDPRKVSILIRLIEDGDQRVREEARKALVKVGVGVIQKLMEIALKHKDAMIRFNAAQAIGEILNNQNLPSLIMKLADEEVSTLESIIQLLHGTNEGLDSVEKIVSIEIEAKKLGQENKNPDLREFLASLLKKLNTKRNELLAKNIDIELDKRIKRKPKDPTGERFRRVRIAA